MNKGGGIPKRVVQGLSGVAVDSLKAAAKEPVNIAREAAGQLKVAPEAAVKNSAEQTSPDSRHQQVEQIRRQLEQMKQGSSGQEETDGQKDSPPSQIQPERAAKLEEEMKQAREEKEKKYDEIEEEFLRRVEADRKKAEEEVEADAAEIIPQGRKKRGLPPGVAGRQGTRETKFKQGK